MDEKVIGGKVCAKRSPPGRLASVLVRQIWNDTPPSASTWTSCALRERTSLARRHMKKCATTAVNRVRMVALCVVMASLARRQATVAGSATRLALDPWESSQALVKPASASATRSVEQGLGKPAAMCRLRMGER